jgi:glucosyl-dolichyl phosphate glucuronosyltransferase
MTVSVIICAYTEARWGQIEAAVASVRGQTAPAEQVILVVDHNVRVIHAATGESSGN